MTKITMTLLVRDEADVIEGNVRFHAAQGVDAFLVMDNLSTDGTPAILARLAEEFDLAVIPQTDDDYHQSRWVTQMARRAAAEGADWVVNADADEFWIAEGGLKALLAAQPPEVAGLRVERHNAVLTGAGAEGSGATAHPAASEVFEARSLNALGDPLPPKVLHRASEAATVGQGNHRVDGLAGRIEDAAGLRILHYPHRTRDRYVRKVRLGAAAYGRNRDLSPTLGTTWKDHAAGVEDGTVDRFWAAQSLEPEEVALGLATGALLRDPRVAEALSAQAADAARTRLAAARTRLMAETEAAVADFARRTVAPLLRTDPARRRERPMYYNLRFALRGPEAQAARLAEAAAGDDPAAVAARYGALRDASSLFPANPAPRAFLAELLDLAAPDAARLRADVAGRRVVVHTSCEPRLDDTDETIRSFAPMGDLHHLALVGTPGAGGEDATPLGLRYDGRLLRVPVPDGYADLHRKLLYAFTLLDLVGPPRMAVKIDDNVLLDDPARFEALLGQVEGAAYAGRRVGGATHDRQWHGWHVGKCGGDPVEGRGYQYPLPRTYAAGGHGYVLGPKGLRACAYAYLNMKAFFAMDAVGLEDCCVGHAMHAAGIDLTDLSDEDHLLALPGLTTKERRRLDAVRPGGTPPSLDG